MLLTQYHLGRGRRAREAGAPEVGALEARRALALSPQNPWAHALLGQGLLRSRTPDLPGARQALERARGLDPTNGYFVRLLLEVLDAQGDTRGRTELLHRAWWAGAPVERWLPSGPPQPPVASGIVPAVDRPEQTRPSSDPATAPAAGRQPVPV